MKSSNTSIRAWPSLGLAVLAACSAHGDGSTFATGAGSGSGGPAIGAGGSGIGTSGSATTGIISTTGAGGNPGGGGSGTVDRDASCGQTAAGAKLISTDVYVLEDRSTSMNCPVSDDLCDNPPSPIVSPTRWDAFTMAVNSFVNSPAAAGVGVGIGFFPLGGGSNCSASAYAKPSVSIAPLPGNAMPIGSAIAATSPSGGTPTLPALTGAIDYAKAYTMNTPGRTAAVLLVTDGIPNGCNSTIAAAAMVAQQAFMGTPPIKTYVVGLGNTAALDQIALAGTGGMTHYFPATGNVADALVTALKQITSQISCNYAIPMRSSLDPSLVNVQITVGANGTPMDIGKVNDASACPAAGGWYYDNNAKPTQIVLCPQSCDPLKMNVGSSVEVLYGCASRPPS